MNFMSQPSYEKIRWISQLTLSAVGENQLFKVSPWFRETLPCGWLANMLHCCLGDGCQWYWLSFWKVNLETSAAHCCGFVGRQQDLSANGFFRLMTNGERSRSRAKSLQPQGIGCFCLKRMALTAGRGDVIHQLGSLVKI